MARWRLGVRGSGSAVGVAGASPGHLGRVRGNRRKSQMRAHRTSGETPWCATMALPPPTGAEMRALYPVLGAME